MGHGRETHVHRLGLPSRGRGCTFARMSTLSDKRFGVFNAAVSGIAILFLGWLLLVNRGTATGLDLSFVPALNACLNASSAVLLVLAVRAIKGGNRALHMRLMLSALGCSALFLAGYVAYHLVHADTHFAGTGVIKAVYLLILATHVVLSMTVLPLALTCLYLAYQERFAAHRKVARVAFPIWLYVSVTGVVIFFMLRGSRG